jgi:hypothetical protein
MWLCGHLQLNQLLHRAEGGGELALVLVLALCKLAYGWSAYTEHSSWLCGDVQSWRGMCKAGCIRGHQLPTARPAQCLSVRACMCLCLAAAVVGYGTPRCAAACQASNVEFLLKFFLPVGDKNKIDSLKHCWSVVLERKFLRNL